MQKRTENGMVFLYGRTPDIKEIAKTIKESQDKAFTVVNEHETFYGWDFRSELKETLDKQGVTYDLAITAWDCHEGFPKKMIITKTV